MNHTVGFIPIFTRIQITAYEWTYSVDSIQVTGLNWQKIVMTKISIQHEIYVWIYVFIITWHKRSRLISSSLFFSNIGYNRYVDKETLFFLIVEYVAIIMTYLNIR
jgi:hypothetical protein